MIHHPNTDFLGKIAKWLLAITMLFSLSAFSGYIGDLQRPACEAARTELVVHGKQVVKRHVSYRGAQIKHFQKQIIPGFYKFEMRLVSLINYQLFKVTVNSGSRYLFSFKQSGRFYLPKTIPQSSDEDPHYLFRG